MVYNATINLLNRKMRVNGHGALSRFTTSKHVLPGHSSDQFNTQSYLIFFKEKLTVHFGVTKRNTCISVRVFLSTTNQMEKLRKDCVFFVS